MSDPHMHLVRALAERAAGPVALVDTRCIDWTSATFAGHRHVIRFDATPEAAERLCAGLEPAAFALPGHDLADIAVGGRTGGRVTIRALTIRRG